MGGPTIEEVVERAATFREGSVRVSELSGGLTNVNHLVEVGGNRYVVRIPGRSTELLAVDRANERYNAEAASTTGVSPRIVEYLDGWNVMVLEFIEGETMSGAALRSPEQAARIAGSLRRLHGGPPFLRDFDMFRLTEFYLRVCDERSVTIPDGFRDRLARVAEIERAFTANPVDVVPCHNDLLAENYIDDGGSCGSSTSSTAATTIPASSSAIPRRSASSTPPFARSSAQRTSALRARTGSPA